MQFVVVDGVVGEFVLLSCFVGEEDGVGLLVDGRSDDVSFAELYGFESVIVLGSGMRPAASVGTDHVPALVDGSEDKTKLVLFYDLPIAETNRQPVTAALFDPKAKSLHRGLAESRLKQDELVACPESGLRSVFVYEGDICVL